MLEVMIPTLAQAPVPVPTPAQVQTPPAPVPAIVQAPAVAKRQRVRILAPVQDQVQDEAPAPVVVNAPPVVNTTLVAAVVNAPAGVQQLVGQVQDLVIQHVAVQNVVPETPMEVEDEDALLQRLFFKRFGRALPEEKEKDDVDQIKFVIDLTDDTDEMEVATPVEVAVVKTELIEAPEIVANVADVAKQRRASRRLEIIELARARKAITEFGKSLRKTDVIPEKEAPENVIADNDTDMAEDVSVNPVGSVNAVESVTTVNTESGNTVMTY